MGGGSTSVVRTSRRKRRPYKSPSIDDPLFTGISFSYHLTADSGLSCRFQLRNLSPATRMRFWDSFVRGKGRDDAPRCCRNEEGRTSASFAATAAEEMTATCAVRDHLPCSSCGSESTPLWRDRRTPSGRVLPLCNACGIRFRKNGQRCTRCGYIPRSRETETDCHVSCPRCLAPTPSWR